MKADRLLGVNVVKTSNVEGFQTFLLERFFSIPGIGDILITAINTGDFPVIKGLSVLIAIAYSFFNLLTDLLYAFVDPRVQLS